MSVLILLNPMAGARRNRDAIAREVVSLFPPGEAELVVPGSKDDMHRRAQEAASAGISLVVAIGGDGTVHEVASALTGSSTTLGVVPLGSGNGFARGLGIDAAPPQAMKVLSHGEDVAIDVGMVNGRPFFSVSGIGFDAVVGEEFNRTGVRGFLPYLGIAAWESLQYKPVEVHLKMDDRELVTQVFLVAVANVNQYGGGARIAPRADPADGLLDVVVIRNLSALEFLFHAPKLFDGTLEDLSRLETLRSRAFRLVRTQSGPMHLDGEPVRMGHVLDYSIRPGALKVRMPRKP